MNVSTTLTPSALTQYLLLSPSLSIILSLPNTMEVAAVQKDENEEEGDENEEVKVEKDGGEWALQIFSWIFAVIFKWRIVKLLPGNEGT